MREKKHQKIELSRLQLNEGQLAGLPKNPRFIKDEKFKDLCRSIETSPEFLDARPLLVYPLDGGNFITLCGNMRLRACRELGMTDAPCYVFPKNTPIEKLREYTIKDNVPFGQTDWDVLKEWDAEELKEWSFDVPEEWLNDELEDFPTGEEDGKIEKSEEVEAMLNTATEKAAAEIVAQYDKLQGFSFVTPNTAKFDFIRFAYYDREYPRYNSLAFHPKQFVTSGDNYSTYEGLQMVAAGKTKGERLRFVCQDKFRAIISGSLAFGGAKMPMDFPASLARDLINEFAEGGRVLDPCAGWGGRLVGFLASDATEYDGTDASPYQCDGDQLIYDTFRDVTQGDKTVTITCSPFEKRTLRNDYYDMAITSPPYFDTEKYLGGEQSRETSANYEQWRDTFYRVLIQKTFDALKAGGIFCLQVGSQRYPLLTDGTEIAKEAGFEVIDVRPTEMVNNQTKTDEDKGEVVIILKK
jgi:tRNA1(Val) A37 N6-methylase TrmN6